MSQNACKYPAARLIFGVLASGERAHLATERPDFDVQRWAESRTGAFEVLGIRVVIYQDV